MTTDDDWKPLSARADAEAWSRYDALAEGVPPYLFESLWSWIRARVTKYVRSGSGYSATPYATLNESKLREIERRLRHPLGWASGADAGYKALRAACANDRDFMLNVADFLLRESGDAGLEPVLAEAGSAWRVGTYQQKPALERRVPLGVQHAAETAFGHANAGSLLSEAWQAVYGTSSNPSEGYRLAVRAVEAAAIPKVLPKDGAATLGKVIAALTAAPAKWDFTFTVDSKVDPFDVLVSMLRMLWTNQYDRHVATDAPLHVSREEAEAAVVLAVTLVQWFSDGHVKRR